MASPSREAIARSRKLFGGPSEKPKPPQRKATVASKKELAARKAIEDVWAARIIAKLYDEPCDVNEFK